SMCCCARCRRASSGIDANSGTEPELLGLAADPVLGSLGGAIDRFAGAVAGALGPLAGAGDGALDAFDGLVGGALEAIGLLRRLLGCCRRQREREEHDDELAHG